MRIHVRIAPIETWSHVIRCFRLFTIAVDRERVDLCAILRIIRRAQRILSNSLHPTSKWSSYTRQRLRRRKRTMNSFTCPLCYSQRAFQTFANFLRHVTTYHQNDSDFRIVCSLGPTCGTLYRTFSAYKSHVYRHHRVELHPIRPNARDIPSYDDDPQQTETDEVIGSNSTDDLMDRDSDTSDTAECERADESDSDWDQMANLLKSHGSQDGHERTLRDLIKLFVLFLLQLREDFFLPKHTMNMITNYIISLIERLQALLLKSAVDCPLRDLSSTSATCHTWCLSSAATHHQKWIPICTPLPRPLRLRTAGGDHHHRHELERQLRDRLFSSDWKNTVKTAEQRYHPVSCSAQCWSREKVRRARWRSNVLIQRWSLRRPNRWR